MKRFSNQPMLVIQKGRYRNESRDIRGKSMNLELRTEQLLALTDEVRNSMDDSNPIMHAELGPNRFSIMSLFFSDHDGVKIQEDLDLNEISVEYFTDTETTELTEGPIYDWALDFYNND